MKVVAVTGGIASGKNTVAEIFAQNYNIPIIDSDQIAKTIVDNNIEILNRIKSKFGSSIILNNKLDRRKLRDIIFNSPEDKIWLEQLLHPEINKEIRNQVRKLQSKITSPYCLVLIPLVTKEYLANNKFINKVLVVDCPPEQQLQRASHRDNQSTQQIEKIIKNQISREQRLELADYVIENNTKITDLEAQIDHTHQALSP